MEAAQLSISRWVDKTIMGHLHMECYSAIKKDKILLFVTLRMGLKNIMLSEMSQRKTNTKWFHTYVESKEQIQLTGNIETGS